MISYSNHIDLCSVKLWSFSYCDLGSTEGCWKTLLSHFSSWLTWGNVSSRTSLLCFFRFKFCQSFSRNTLQFLCSQRGLTLFLVTFSFPPNILLQKPLCHCLSLRSPIVSQILSHSIVQLYANFSLARLFSLQSIAESSFNTVTTSSIRPNRRSRSLSHKLSMCLKVYLHIPILNPNITPADSSGPTTT